MLPFKKESSMAQRVEVVQRPPDESREYDILEDIFEELMHAVQTNNKRAGAEAMRAMFDLLDAQPHYEGPHTNG